MTTQQKCELLQTRLEKRGLKLDLGAVMILRRAEMTLHRWYELECGTDAGAIERDEKTGIPYWYNANSRFVQANDRRCYTRTPDRESGAKKRVHNVCAVNNIHYYIQSDPRGCALYISKEPMTDSNYSSIGYAVCD